MRWASGWLTALLAVGACAPAYHDAPLPGAPEDAVFARLGDARLRFTDRGEGPAVVLIHGFASSLNVWNTVAPELASQFRVVAVDLMGFGWSNRPDADYSPAAQAALVWQLLDKLGVADAALVAHSWGSSVALAMALERPARVRQLALYSAWALEEQIPPFFLWAREPGVGEMLFSLFYKERVEERMRHAFFDKALVDEERLGVVDSVLERPGTVAAALAATRGQRFRELQQRYGEVHTPVLLLWGKNDEVSLPSAAERLLRLLPQSDVRWYPRCGHFPMVEAFEASTTDLVEFLGGTRAMPPSNGASP